MNLLQENFTDVIDDLSIIPSEAECKIIFKNYREKMGITCKCCGSKNHYYLKTKFQWQCKQCRFRTTLKSGTSIENSKLPLRFWFYAIYITASEIKGVSAKSLQRLLGQKRYQPVWSMLHKLRRAFHSGFCGNLYHDLKKRKKRSVLRKNGKIGVEKGANGLIWWSLVPKRKIRFAPRTFSKRMMPIIEITGKKFMKCSKTLKWIDEFWRTIRSRHRWVSDKYLQNYLSAFVYIQQRKLTEIQRREMILTRLLIV